MFQDQNKNLTNGELVKHLDQHNISTPLINKYLYEQNAYMGMKTPAPFPLLTPNSLTGSLPSNHPMLQSQVSVRANFFQLSEFKTPCENMDPSEKITIIGQQQQQNASYNNSNANQQYRAQDSMDDSVYMNPNHICVGQGGNNATSLNNNNNNSIPEYTNLNNRPEMNGNHQVNILF